MEKMVTMPERRYLELKRKAELDEELLIKVNKGFRRYKSGQNKGMEV